MCQLMTSSHTVIVHPLLVFLEYGWCNLITPVLLLCYSDLNQVSIWLQFSCYSYTHSCTTTLSSRCLLLVCECGVHLTALQRRLFSLFFIDNTCSVYFNSHSKKAVRISISHEPNWSDFMTDIYSIRSTRANCRTSFQCDHTQSYSM